MGYPYSTLKPRQQHKHGISSNTNIYQLFHVFYLLFFEDFDDEVDRKGSTVGDTDVEGTSDG